jgi:hypothetical protein
MGSGGEDKEGGVCAQCEIGRVGKLHAWERREWCAWDKWEAVRQREKESKKKLIKEGFGGGVSLIQGD